MYSSLCRLTTLLLLEKREDTSVFMSLNHFYMTILDVRAKETISKSLYRYLLSTVIQLP